MAARALERTQHPTHRRRESFIARALAPNPRLVLADEPTGNLDTATGEIVLQLLRRTVREFPVAVLMATHSAESTAAAGRIIHLRDGRIEPAPVLQST